MYSTIMLVATLICTVTSVIGTCIGVGSLTFMLVKFVDFGM